MIPICDHCDNEINANNHRHPGYCSTTCRDAAHQQRKPVYSEPPVGRNRGLLHRIRWQDGIDPPPERWRR